MVKSRRNINRKKNKKKNGKTMRSLTGVSCNLSRLKKKQKNRKRTPVIR